MRTFKVLCVLAMFVLSGFALLDPVAATPGPTETTQRIVLVELFTGAWCGYCPFATSALRTMESNYERSEVVFLAWHSGDILEINDGAARDNWYGVTGYPTAFFDGVIKEVGGSTGTYNTYVDAYDTRSAIASELRMTLHSTLSPVTGAGEVWVNITCLQTPTLTDLRLHTVVFENDYGPYNGGNGEQTHDFVAREMLEGVNGATISVSEGDVRQFHYDVNATTYAQDYDQLGIIAFVQSHNNKEVLQAAYYFVPLIPNVPPSISQGQASLLSCTEDDYVTFKVWYRDPDDTKNKGPGEKKVFIRNETMVPVEYDLSVVASSDPWTFGKWLAWTGKLPPGNYTYKFNVTDGEDWALGDVDWNATTVVVRPRNKLPELMEYNYAPFTGDTRTEFTFDIMYRDLDNQVPASAQIFINGVPHDMVTDSTGPWNDWVTYYYKTTLPPGEDHKFYYLFSDGLAQVRLPIATASPNWISGPDVLPPNEAPSLTTELFSPATGTRATNFVFSVIYTDGESDYPSVSYIYLDSVPQLMMGLGSNFANGVKFEYTTKLPLGTHSYYFLFNDGKGHEARHPVAGSFEGPTVTNLGPTADISSPATGTRYTPTDYVPFSAVDSSDPENDALTYAWTSDIDGDLGDQDAFDTRLSEGWHNITLVVTDAYGASATATLQLEVRPYRPHAFIKDLRLSDERPLEKDTVRITVTVSNDGEAIAEALDVTILVDGNEVYSSTERVSVGTDREVAYTWVSVAGTHTIRAEITGDSDEIDVLVDANKVPTAEPTVYNPGGVVVKYTPGDEVFFRANSNDADGDLVTWEWDFGDGTVKSMQRDPSHVYTAAGAYTVTLKVTDERGGVTTKTFEVIVDKPKEEEPGFGAALAALAILGAIGASFAVSRRRL